MLKSRIEQRIANTLSVHGIPVEQTQGLVTKVAQGETLEFRVITCSRSSMTAQSNEGRVIENRPVVCTGVEIKTSLFWGGGA